MKTMIYSCWKIKSWIGSEEFLKERRDEEPLSWRTEVDFTWNFTSPSKLEVQRSREKMREKKKERKWKKRGWVRRNNWPVIFHSSSWVFRLLKIPLFSLSLLSPSLPPFSLHLSLLLIKKEEEIGILCQGVVLLIHEIAFVSISLENIPWDF